MITLIRLELKEEILCVLIILFRGLGKYLQWTDNGEGVKSSFHSCTITPN